MFFSKNQYIGEYKVIFPIKKGDYAETYRVKGADGKLYFLKLFNYSKLRASQFDENLNVLEVEISKKIVNENIVKYHDNGDLILNGNKLGYLVQDFISGETIAERLSRETFSVYEAKQIIIQVLRGLDYLHSQEKSIIHNEISIQNIMLDLSQKPFVAKIIDLGHARYVDQKRTSFDKRGLNLFALASETYNGIFTPQSDLFSIGVMLFQMLFKVPPYFIDLSDYKKQNIDQEEAILTERRKGIKIPNIELFELDDNLISIIEKALANEVEDRFISANDFIKALTGEVKVEQKPKNDTDLNKKKAKNIRRGNGFKDVIGMTELKNRLQYDVIDLIKNPEEAKTWGIGLPNGLLFYGPPGCGKTYFAEKFAEEAGFNFISAHCSDIASPYIHGGQTKIAELFKQARENAPTILFLDELDAILTDRNKQNNVSESGEVNEFLVQLNNCGADGVIVIGATNFPLQIDKAALRSGRLELKYYIPQPDEAARKALFELYLKQTKVDFGLDYAHLAAITPNYVSSEIKLIAEEAVRMSRRQRLPYVTMEVLESVIREHKQDLTSDEIKKYERERDEFEGNKKSNDRKPIGFC